VTRLVTRLGRPPTAADESAPASGAVPQAAENQISEPLAQKPTQLEARTFIAVRRFLLADAARAPLMLIFDDIERASPETVKLLHYLAAGVEEAPVVMLAAGRPNLFEVHPTFGQGEAELERIEIGPLTADESGQLLAELVRPAGEPPLELQRHARERLGGSPRALFELVRYLLESGGVKRVGKAWTFDRLRLQPRRDTALQARRERVDAQPASIAALTGRVEAAGLPATLEDLVAARLRALDAGARDLLGKAAACGETFWFDALVALRHTEAVKDPEAASLDEIVADGSRIQKETSATLAALVQRGLVTESPHSRVPGEREFRFAYPPWWEVVYGSLDEQARRRYHRLVAQWLELRPEGPREDQQEEVARHLERAGDGDGAALRYRRAADGARARYYNDRAIRLYQRALGCVSPGDLAARIHLCHDLGSVYQLKGENEPALRAYERMLRLSWLCASRTKAAVAFNKMGRIDRQKGELDAALSHFERGLDLFRQVDDERGVAGSLDDIAQVLWLLGRYDEALDRGAKALEKRRRIGDKQSIALSLLTIGQIERHRGLFQEAESCYREALAIRRALEDRAGIAASLNGLGALAYQRGDYEGSRRCWEEALAIAEEIGALPLVALLEDHLGEAARQLGNLVEARTRFERSESAARDLDDKRLLSEALRNLGMLELQQGDLQKALELCQRSFELADQSGIRVDAGRALVALGEIHARTLFHDRGEADAAAQGAEMYFRRAVDLFREIGNEAELGVALERFGTYTVERGELEGGKRLLAEAHQIFTRLGMAAVGAEVQRMMTELE
jgi:tetratricopeptide (TPR) repeat protein